MGGIALHISRGSRPAMATPHLVFSEKPMKSLATASMLFGITLFFTGCGGDDYTTTEDSSNNNSTADAGDTGGGPGPGGGGMDQGMGAGMGLGEDLDGGADAEAPGADMDPGAIGLDPAAVDMPPGDMPDPATGLSLSGDPAAVPDPAAPGAPGAGAPTEALDPATAALDPAGPGAPGAGDPAAPGAEAYVDGPGGFSGGASKKLPVLEGDPAPAKTAEEGLDTKIAELDFVKTPLPEALKYLTHVTGVPLEVGAGIAADKVVGAIAQNVTLEDTLFIITEPYELAFHVKRDGSAVTIKPRTRRDKTSGGSKAAITLRKKVTGDFAETPIKDVMAAVTQSSGVHFILCTNVDGAKPITITARSMSIRDFMRKIDQMGYLHRVSKSGRVVLIANGG
jgi:hypothetical protein